MQAQKKIQEEVSILIVDDEESILKSLQGIFTDEGYATLTASNSDDAMKIILEQSPSLVMLDIWMPGRDGIDTLKQIKEKCPDLPVIMISGHASIATAVEATKLGANNFIEKPLDLHGTLQAVKRALEGGDKPSALAEDTSSESSEQSFLDSSSSIEISPIVFSKQSMRGRTVTQKTLAESSVIYGHGVHTGKKSGLTLEPLPANSGIHFVSVIGQEAVPAHTNFVYSTGYATTLKNSNTQVSTIEHLMSALHAYGISNLLITCNEEVPVLDGSSLEFCNLIEEVGVVAQEGDYYSIKVDKEYKIGDEI